MMRSFQYWKNGKLLLISLLLMSCASVPDSLKGTTERPQQNFMAIHHNAVSLIGQEARLGGQILSVTNYPQYTRLEISSMPLDDSARPILSSSSQGRFFADTKRFLEPTDYQNHFITIVGTITGLEKGKIGAMPYDFVTIKISGLQRWNLIQPRMYHVPNVWMGPWDNRSYLNGPGSSWGNSLPAGPMLTK